MNVSDYFCLLKNIHHWCICKNVPCLKATYFYLGRAGTLLDNPLVTDPLTHLQETVTPKVRGDRDVYGNTFFNGFIWMSCRSNDGFEKVKINCTVGFTAGFCSSEMFDAVFKEEIRKCNNIINIITIITPVVQQQPGSY